LGRPGWNKAKFSFRKKTNKYGKKWLWKNWLEILYRISAEVFLMMVKMTEMSRNSMNFMLHSSLKVHCTLKNDTVVYTRMPFYDWKLRKMASKSVYFAEFGEKVCSESPHRSFN
jgi:hypothetical protein